jgi:hypothetical protein
MNKGSGFNADVRNLGGRQQIIDRMNMHYRCVDAAKPTISSKPNPAALRKIRAASSFVSPYQKFLNKFEYAYLDNQIKKMKHGTIDNAEPKSWVVGKRISNNRRK